MNTFAFVYMYIKLKVKQKCIIGNLRVRGIFNVTFSISISHCELFLKEKIKIRLFCII